MQDQTESSAPEPIDEVMPSMGWREASSGSRQPSMSAQSMAAHGERSAGRALAAFPQIVHLLANPELHLGRHLSASTGLPLVSLGQGTSVDDLESMLTKPEFADGFILEGIPADRASAENLDGLLSATNPSGRRVLGWESESAQQQEIVDHYIDQGLMWVVPAPDGTDGPQKVKSSLLECLVGLPALH